MGNVRLKELRPKDVVDGLDVTLLETNRKCEDCIYGKQTRHPFDEIVLHKTEVLEHIHTDLWGPARTVSAGGKKILMLCVDGASSCRDSFFLSEKEADTMLEAYRLYVAKAERETGKKVKRVRVDSGSEFKGGWILYCADHGIVIETTPACSSSANRVTECGIRTTIERTHCMMKDTVLPPKYWADTTATAIYLQNFLPSSRNPNKTPFELFSGK